MAGNGKRPTGNGEYGWEDMDLVDRVTLAAQPLRVIYKLFELLYERNRGADARFVEIEPEDMNAIATTLGDAMERLESATEK